MYICIYIWNEQKSEQAMHTYTLTHTNTHTHTHTHERARAHTHTHEHTLTTQLERTEEQPVSEAEQATHTISLITTLLHNTYHYHFTTQVERTEEQPVSKAEQAMPSCNNAHLYLTADEVLCSNERCCVVKSQYQSISTSPQMRSCVVKW